MIAFCDTEEDLRKADRIFDSMTPRSDTGRRVSVDLYEVTLDETATSSEGGVSAAADSCLMAVRPPGGPARSGRNEPGRPSKANTVAAKVPSRVHDASCPFEGIVEDMDAMRYSA